MFDIRKIQEQVIFEAVEKASNEQVAKQVIGEEEEDHATWVKNTMKRLENQFKPDEVKAIRMNCQCGYGMDEKVELVKSLMAKASSLEEFANEGKAAGLSCESGKLYLQFPFCPCPMLAEVERLETATWCQCTTGYSKVLFERAFGCKVEVELLKSVKMGDELCLMEIRPEAPIWKEVKEQ